MNAICVCESFRFATDNNLFCCYLSRKDSTIFLMKKPLQKQLVAEKKEKAQIRIYTSSKPLESE